MTLDYLNPQIKDFSNNFILLQQKFITFQLKNKTFSFDPYTFPSFSTQIHWYVLKWTYILPVSNLPTYFAKSFMPTRHRFKS